MARKRAGKKPFIFKAWFVGALRRISRRYPPINEALNKVKSEYYIESKNGKKLRRVQYECASCHEKHSRTNVNVDHVEPVISTQQGFPLLPDGSPDWNAYIARLFVQGAALQVLCSRCHDEKTQIENKERRDRKKICQ